MICPASWIPKIILIIWPIANIIHQRPRIKNMSITQFRNISSRLVINCAIFSAFRARSHTFIDMINTLSVVVELRLNWILVRFYRIDGCFLENEIAVNRSLSVDKGSWGWGMWRSLINLRLYLLGVKLFPLYRIVFHNFLRR